MKFMKGCIWFLVVLVSLSGVSFAQEGSETETQEREVVEEIVAKVNGAIITRSDLEREREDLIVGLRSSPLSASDRADYLEQAEPNLLRDKIDNLLLIQKAEELEIDVDSEVTRYMADLMLQTGIAEQDEFAELVARETGMPYEDYRQKIRDNLLVEHVMGSEVGSQIVIPMAEVEQYYKEHPDEFIREERVFLREILISTEDRTEEEALEKAEQIVERARRAERFEDLATDESDANTALDGGLLNPVMKGDLISELEEAVWDKERNYVTDPIKTPNGYLILKVDQHHQAGLASLTEVENEILAKLREPLWEPKAREYLTDLRQQAFLEIKEGWVDSSAAPGKDTSWSDPAELTPPTVTREEVFAHPGRKKALWLFPIPGTEQGPISVSQ